jgi:hypothetical protein
VASGLRRPTDTGELAHDVLRLREIARRHLATERALHYNLLAAMPITQFDGLQVEIINQKAELNRRHALMDEGG